MRKLSFWMIVLIAVLLAAGCRARPADQPVQASAGDARALLGEWQGQLDVLGMSLDLVVRFEEKGGRLEGSIDIPGQGVAGNPLSNIQVTSDEIRFEYESNLPAGVFSSPGVDGDTLAGDYRQLGYKGTFSLQRSDGQVAPEAPEVIREPLPYLEEEVRVQNGDVALAGTLTLPATGGPHPAVILISGSGLQDRNNGHPSLPGYEPFLWLADHLTRQGIAVMRYDDRGMNESVGGELGTDTTFDYSTDTEAVFDFLLEHPQINPAQVGVLGHSEGGHIAALVAARRPEAAFAISLAGTAVNGADLLMLQTELVARAEGLDEAEIARRMESNRTEVDLILAQDWDELEVFLTGAVRQYYLDLPAEQRVSDDELEGAIRDTVAHSMKNNRGWVHYFFSHDPAQDWARVQAPVLAIFGSLDKQVDPEQNAGPLEEALANNPDATVLVAPNANHLFQEAATGGADEYARLPHEFVDGLLDIITEWLLERVDVQ